MWLFPELALFETESERRAIVNRFAKRQWRTPQFWLCVLLYLVTCVLLVAAWLFLFHSSRWRGSLPPWSLGVPIGLAGPILVLALRQTLRKPGREFIRQELCARGVPICVKCGYDLRGQVDPRCPECGRAFDPKLTKRPSDPAPGPSDGHDAANRQGNGDHGFPLSGKETRVRF